MANTGFSVGDELGFGESLGNLDGNKRRSISHADQLIAANSVGTVPASKQPVSQRQTKCARSSLLFSDHFELLNRIHVDSLIFVIAALFSANIIHGGRRETQRRSIVSVPFQA